MARPAPKSIEIDLVNLTISIEGFIVDKSEAERFVRCVTVLRDFVASELEILKRDDLNQ